MYLGISITKIWQNHRFWGILICNTQHLMAEPLELTFPKYPSTTLLAAYRLCVYSVCWMGIRKNLGIVAYTGTIPSLEPSDSNKQCGYMDAVLCKQWFGQSFCLNSFIVFGHDTVNFGTRNVLQDSIQSLATSTLAPTIFNRNFIF